jgi:argininosuccinate lyase
MINLEAHKKLLKYSFDKIKTKEDFNKKLSYLKEFKENGVIDQPTYDQLLKFLEEKRTKIKGMSN